MKRHFAGIIMLLIIIIFIYLISEVTYSFSNTLPLFEGHTEILNTNFKLGNDGWMVDKVIEYEYYGSAEVYSKITDIVGNPPPSLEIEYLSEYRKVTAQIYRSLVLPNLGSNIPVILSFNIMVNATMANWYSNFSLSVTVYSGEKQASQQLLKYQPKNGTNIHFFMNWTTYEIDLRSLTNLNGFDIAGRNITLAISIKEYGYNDYGYLYIDNVNVYIPLDEKYIYDSIPPKLSVSFIPVTLANKSYVYTNSSSIWIRWSADDDTYLWRIYLRYGSSILDVTNISSYSLVLPRNGSIVVSIVAEDLAGNRDERKFYITRVPNDLPPPPLLPIVNNTFLNSSINSYFLFLMSYMFERDPIGTVVVVSLISIIVIVAYFSISSKRHISRTLNTALERVYSVVNETQEKVNLTINSLNEETELVKKDIRKTVKKEISKIHSKVEEFTTQIDELSRTIGEVINTINYLKTRVNNLDERVRSYIDTMAGNKVMVKVVDAWTKEPIKGVDIFLNDKYIASTGEDGVAEFSAPIGKHKLRLTAENYVDEEIDITMNASTQISVRLFMDLPTIVNKIAVSKGFDIDVRAGIDLKLVQAKFDDFMNDFIKYKEVKGNEKLVHATTSIPNFDLVLQHATSSIRNEFLSKIGKKAENYVIMIEVLEELLKDAGYRFELNNAIMSALRRIRRWRNAIDHYSKKIEEHELGLLEKSYINGVVFLKHLLPKDIVEKFARTLSRYIGTEIKTRYISIRSQK